MKKDKINLGKLFVFTVPAIAVGLWLLAPSVDLKFESFYDIFSFLGRGTAILGMMLFAVTLIMSARFQALENLFRGLDRLYSLHSKLGQYAFILLLFHPLLLLVKFTDLSLRESLLFFVPDDNLAVNFGIFSLLTLLALIFLTLYLRPRYHVWKISHKFMGFAFFLGGVHAFLIPSDTSSFLPLRVYVLLVTGVALYAFVYHTIFGKYTKKKYEYELQEVKEVGGNVVEIFLKPRGEKMEYIPGQYAFLSFHDEKVGKESHPFSMTSSPDNNELSFSIKKSGDYTKKLGDLTKGVKVLVEGPFGKFSYTGSLNKKQIWIAGGIGLTPFLSMARSIKKEEPYEVDLYYCVRDEGEAIYLKELLSSELAGIKVIPHFSTRDGYIDANIIEKMSGSLKEKSIFICAPVSMIKSLKKQFAGKGVPENLLHSEEFGF